MPAAALDYVLLIPSLAISLFIVVPLTGVLVRFRANYTPRGLALDPDGAAFPHTGPVVNSYFGMFRRVWQIEGFSGLYKGLMPTFLSALVLSLTIITFMDAPRTHQRHNSYRLPATGILGTLFYSLLMMLLSLPSAIITYRAITTPHRLGYLQPIKALRVLLTPTERRRPWIIYLTPGLLFAQCLHVAYVTLILTPLHSLLVPISEDVAYPEISPVKLTIYFAVVIVSTGILTPLEVISTRLAIQRNQASAEYNSVSPEVEGDAEDVPEYTGAEEDVIGLRTEAEPYTGLVDCAKTIINEEGFRALYRAWWVTLLGGLLSAFA